MLSGKHFGGLRKQVMSAVVVVVWATGIGFGARVLLQYANTPGASGTPADRWPALSPINPATQGRATLLLFAHPQCPCSRASLGELALIVACCADRVEATVLFALPDRAEEWTATGLWHDARRIPGVHVLADRNGTLARRFGARTSGEAILYNAAGRLMFHGGITASRGHSGDNDGRDAIVALLSGRLPRQRITPVFGCALFTED
jgi:hypothetical protein